MARARTAVADPAELEKLEWPPAWPPPWRNERLVGHDIAERTMLLAHHHARLHHAWLLTGPRGIGKATLAWRFARFLLASQPFDMFAGAPDSLSVSANAPDNALKLQPKAITKSARPNRPTTIEGTLLISSCDKRIRFGIRPSPAYSDM